MQKQKVLITGGAGFIGTNLVEYLLDKTNWSINVLDNLSVGSFDNLKKLPNFDQQRVTFFKGDIRNKKESTPAIRGCNYVVHLAAQAGVIPSIKNPAYDAEVNIFGTLNILQQSVKSAVERFILASSAAPLGEQEMPLNESKIPRPLSPYGASKLAGEGYCSAFAGSFDLPCIVLRFSNVYGPKSSQKSSVVAKFCKTILENKPLIIYGDGNQTRDFVYVKDLCEAIYLALTSKLKPKFEIFQIASGKETSINLLFNLFKKIFKNDYGLEIKATYEKPRKGEIYRNYADISKAKKELGFCKITPFRVGLETTIAWFMETRKK